MADSRTVGQRIDEWMAENEPSYETLYFYYDKDANSHIVVTKGVANYDWQDILTEDLNLTAIIEAKKKEVKSLQAEINSLTRDKKTIENAIRKLTKPFATQNKE